MRRTSFYTVFLLACSVLAPSAQISTAQSPESATRVTTRPAKTIVRKAASPAEASNPEGTAITRTVEKYLRNLYAWGPAFKIKLGAPEPTPVSGLLQVPIDIEFKGNKNSGQVFVSSDGRYVLQGELSDMTQDPFAETRRLIRMENAPSSGPADAKVVVVEYGDFQCPSCKQFQQVIKALRPNYPQVRFVFRDFPLTQIHAWAMTASLGGRCVLAQNTDAFWKYYDDIYEGQDLIKPENVWDKTLDQATELGLDKDAFKTCMAAPQTKAQVDASLKEGIALKIANTPTIFVNGRRLVGGDPTTLEQYIQYELGATRRSSLASSPKNQ